MVQGYSHEPQREEFCFKRVHNIYNRKTLVFFYEEKILRAHCYSCERLPHNWCTNDLDATIKIAPRIHVSLDQRCLAFHLALMEKDAVDGGSGAAGEGPNPCRERFGEMGDDHLPLWLRESE
ncbi:hypothetical protein HPP92_010924 [Vanilla planifolia]|uniref:Uncharacterized protein n=1 Tax=Vanilla planifolia TaxID=51239 RepID=A0A835QZY1_VANPL|nr:hypothetical protein HPP92_010924 [Vanilla planifolia]